MSEDRTEMIFAERRTLPVDEDRELEIEPDRRVLPVLDEERLLEVTIP